MKIKFDFLKSDEKDRLKLKKIDSKDILYIELMENSLLFKFINEYNLNAKNITFNTYEIGVNLEKKLNEFLKEFKNSFDILILGRNRIRKTYFTNYEIEYIKKIINNKEVE